MEQILKMITRMDPEEALAEMAKALRGLFLVLDEEARTRFLLDLVGESKGDKVSSLVHLWLAKCMGEGVDPTQMCQSLVDKVAQSKQLMAITDPDLLVLFEDWFEELEEEVVSLVKRHGRMSARELVEKIGLSQRGATFLLSKLKREKKL
jgi:hypothetical protein